MKTSLILACAGKGERVGEKVNKLLLDFDGEKLIDKTISAFVKTGLIDEYILVCSKEDYNYFCEVYGNNFTICLGGKTRTESVKNALMFVSGEVVLIHDGARPFVSEETIKNCINTAKEKGSAVCISPSRDTICKANGEKIGAYIGKNGVYQVKTPQGFLTHQIILAYNNIDNKTFNDDGEVYFNTFNTVNTFVSKDENLKITYPEDLQRLSALPYANVRVGAGFDCHELVENRKLILGGIQIPHSKGLLGHSDADVLVHAIMDALLSGAGLRDIGYYFPDSDEKFKGIDSIVLLKKVLELLDENGYAPSSVSAVIMAQKPKLLSYIPKMISKISSVLGLDENCVGITATTLEGLGFVGREEGICARANSILVKKN